MGAIGAGEPHRRLRSRYVDAPRQVIGFDLSATAGKPRLALDSVDENVFEANVNPAERFNCSRPYANSSKIATPKSNNTTTPSSRSALQQLLLPTPNVAVPTDAFSEDNAPINLSHKPSFIQPALFQAPAAKQPATAAVSKFTSNPCNAFGRGIPVPFTTLNWPASKGFAQLVTRPLVHDRHSDPSSKAAVSELKSGVKVGYRSSQNPEETAHDGSGMSERYLNAKQNLNAKDWLHTERTQSTWTQKAEIEIEHPSGIRCRAELKKDSVGKDRKQARMHTSDKTKKSSLFMITGTSPIAEYGYHGFYGHGADQHNSEGMDMEFLNSCHLCKRKLGQGHDIFMYSGDKAFCSMECRHQQIEMDERKGRHTLPIIRTGTSPAYQSCMGINNSNAVICQTSAANPTAHHHPISISRPRFMNSAAAA